MEKIAIYKKMRVFLLIEQKTEIASFCVAESILVIDRRISISVIVEWTHTNVLYKHAGIFEFSHLSDWNEKQDSTFYNQCLISLCCYVLFSVTFALRRRRRRRRQVRIQYQELRNSHSNNYTTCRRHVWKSQDN
ncbi:hypothetical protein T05_14681 [Trichinella murrelli]|uniref:Uncharacterized protein n=1 Tax=Trichinella murrelli TaxID=144512 RepID=A0A0V0TJ01_9BILA|nr:hypothetical protein T05_14681 [Trichinella murrelli]